MSDISQGPGWWQASDGKWYDPRLAPPGYEPKTPAPVPEIPLHSHSPIYKKRWWIGVAVILLAVATVTGQLLTSTESSNPGPAATSQKNGAGVDDETGSDHTN